MDHSRRRGQQNPWAVFPILALAVFMATLDGGAVNVALPAIAGRFGADLTLVQWTVSGYLLTLCVLLPLAGRLCDAFGPAGLFRAALLVFAAGSALCGLSGLSEKLWLLIAARSFQALGAAFLMAAGPAILLTVFPGPERGRALGAMSTVAAAGALAGPSLGGMILDAFGWQTIFFINLPLALAALVLSLRLLPFEAKSAPAPIDFPGFLFFGLAICALLIALTRAPAWGWLSLRFTLCLVVAIGFALLCLRRESSAPAPLIDPALLARPAFAYSLLACLLAYMAFMGNALVLPFYLHDTLFLPAHIIGLVLSLPPLLTALVSPVSGYVSERIAPARLCAAGFGLMSLALLEQALLPDAAALWRVIACQIILGLGFGLFHSPNNNAALGSAPLDDRGQAAGLLALVRYIGMIAGVAGAACIYATIQADEQVGGEIGGKIGGQIGMLAGLTADAPARAGFRAAFLSAALLAVVGAIVSVRGGRLRRGESGPGRRSRPQLKRTRPQ